MNDSQRNQLESDQDQLLTAAFLERLKMNPQERVAAHEAALLRHVARFAPRGSKLFIHECILSDDKSGPRFTSLFNLLMLLNHSSQQFTEIELGQLLHETGLGAPQTASRAAHYSLLRAEKL